MPRKSAERETSRLGGRGARHWVAALLVLGTVAALALATHATAELVRNRLRADAALSTRVEEWKLTPSPEWITIDAPRKALADAGLTEPLSLADPALVERVGKSLESSAWIRSAKVEKTRAGLAATIDYRRPVAFVPWGAGERGCYVDADAIVLPADQCDTDALRSCLVIEGAPAANLPPVGSPFGDARIRRASRLADALHSSRARLGLVVIAVPARPDGVYVLRAKNGALVRWGAITDTAADLDTRLARLLNHYASTGAIAGGSELDLSTPPGSPR